MSFAESLALLSLLGLTGAFIIYGNYRCIETNWDPDGSSHSRIFWKVWGTTAWKSGLLGAVIAGTTSMVSVLDPSTQWSDRLGQLFSGLVLGCFAGVSIGFFTGLGARWGAKISKKAAHGAAVGALFLQFVWLLFKS